MSQKKQAGGLKALMRVMPKIDSSSSKRKPELRKLGLDAKDPDYIDSNCEILEGKAKTSESGYFEYMKSASKGHIEGTPSDPLIEYAGLPCETRKWHQGAGKRAEQAADAYKKAATALEDMLKKMLDKHPEDLALQSEGKSLADCWKKSAEDMVKKHEEHFTCHDDAYRRNFHRLHPYMDISHALEVRDLEHNQRKALQELKQKQEEDLQKLQKEQRKETRALKNEHDKALHEIRSRPRNMGQHEFMIQSILQPGSPIKFMGK